MSLRFAVVLGGAFYFAVFLHVFWFVLCFLSCSICAYFISSCVHASALHVQLTLDMNVRKVWSCYLYANNPNIYLRPECVVFSLFLSFSFFSEALFFPPSFFPSCPLHSYFVVFVIFSVFASYVYQYAHMFLVSFSCKRCGLVRHSSLLVLIVPFPCVLVPRCTY